MVLISILGFCIPVRIDCLRTFLLIDLWLSRFFLFYNILVLMMLTFQTLQYPFVCVIFEYNFTDSRYLQWSWNFGFLERCITNINHGMLEVNLFHAWGSITNCLFLNSGKQSFHTVHAVWSHVGKVKKKTCLE